MKTYTFKVIVEPDEDAQGNPAWHAYCPALESIGAATSGRTKDGALKKINEVVHMIVQEFIEDGKPLPEGPKGSVDVEEASQEAPRSYRLDRGLPENLLRRYTATAFISYAKPDLTNAIGTPTAGV